MELRFFGPTSSITETSLEYSYILMTHLNFSYKDTYNLPLWKRTWLIRKLIDENKKKSERQKMAEAAKSMPGSNSSRRLFNR